MACLHAQNSFVILLLTLIVFTKAHMQSQYGISAVLFRQFYAYKNWTVLYDH